MADSNGEDAAVAAYFLSKLRKKEEKTLSTGVVHRRNHHVGPVGRVPCNFGHIWSFSIFVTVTFLRGYV